MEEPQELSSAITALMEKRSEGRLHDALAGMLEAHATNQRRRGEVLKHEDLRKRLHDELGYERPANWNGYIPPATVNEFSDEELLRQWKADRDGTHVAHFNEYGRHATGEVLNNSPQRRILVELSTEAWARRTNPREAP